MAKLYGLDKNQKLKSRKLIAEVFRDGKSFSVFPLRVTFLVKPGNNEAGVRVGFTASKKNFRKAVDRNRIKRLLRESYRLQKNELLENVKAANLSSSIFFLYTGKEIAGFQEIKTIMAKALEMVEKKMLHEKHQ